MTPTKVSFEASLPRESPAAPPSPSRTRKNLPEQSLVNRGMLERLDVVVSEPFLENSRSGDRCLVPMEKHSFHRSIKDRLCVRGTGSLPLALREKLFLNLLSL
jgi:hypothetical protein